MPSFDAVLEPNLVEIRNAVDNTSKEINTRFDFKGTSARLELKEKEKEIALHGDSDFQLEQVTQVLIDKLAKRKVELSYLDMSGKVEKMGGDKVKQVLKIKAGIESDLAKKIVGVVKNSKLKVQAAIQGDAVRITGKNRDDLQQAIALLKKDVPDTPLSFNNFRD